MPLLETEEEAEERVKSSSEPRKEKFLKMEELIENGKKMLKI